MTLLGAYAEYMHAFINDDFNKQNLLTSPSISLGYPREIYKGYAGMLSNLRVDRTIIYRDSVAGIVAEYDSMLTIRYMYLINGHWKNASEGLGGNNASEAEQIFCSEAPKCFQEVRRIYALEQYPTDNTAFVEYLNDNGVEPKQFLLDALSKNRLVVYGETHHSKASWDFVRQVINSPDFADFARTIFMELSVTNQHFIDEFFSNEQKNPEIILNVLRNEELLGWCDGGMYEFFLDMWDVNRNLPESKRVKVIATDIPRLKFLPDVTTKEEYEVLRRQEMSTDRNTYMADTIEDCMANSQDMRNCLFIVGSSHAKNNTLLKTRYERYGTVVAQLVARYPEISIFSIFTHSPRLDNSGLREYTLIRGGVFDAAFAASGDSPIGFNLKDSPFGKEPFDVDYNTCYYPAAGNFEDNYDGYIFLSALKDEPAEYYLPELYSDEFIEEIKRRAELCGSESIYGIKYSDLTKEQYIEILREKTENKKRWE